MAEARGLLESNIHPDPIINNAAEGSGTVATRKPMSSLSLVGSALSRLDARRKFSLMTHEPLRPPRSEPEITASFHS